MESRLEFAAAAEHDFGLIFDRLVEGYMGFE